MTPQEPVTIGYFAPLPPAPTGVADYAEALLGALRRLGRVEVGSTRARARLYHLGNNHLHRDIYRRALAEPGVIVLHDAVLHHFLLGTLDERSYVEEFVYNYGEWSRELGRELWRSRARSAADPRYFDYPMLRRVVEASRAVIVHNPGGARRVREHVSGANVVEIPHLFVPPPALHAMEVARLRDRLGVAPRTCLFGVFGHLRESKRLPSILRALDRARRRGAGVALLVAGDFASPDLERAIEPLLGVSGVVRVRYLPERAFWLHAGAVDACLNLRYPSAGETSGIAVRLMGMGKPVVFTAGEEVASIPETACLKVDAGPAEEEMLADFMIWLARFPESAAEIGRRAARHIAGRHNLDRVAAEYRRVVEESVAPAASQEPAAERVR